MTEFFTIVGIMVCVVAVMFVIFWLNEGRKK